MEYLIAAISLGLLGSFHCIGMCGPIALALPIGEKSKGGQLFSILLYNFGRMITYGVFGLASGLLGKMFFVAGWQQVLSIVAGSLILFFTLLPAENKTNIKLFNGFFSFSGKLKSSFGKLFGRKSNFSIFSIGLLNGFLPCGLVYTGIAGATLTMNAWHGALFMMTFGLGTLPVMASLAWFRNLISLNARNKIRKMVPYLVSVMAIMLIVRGLNLGIPYLSPKTDTATKTMGACCAEGNSKTCATNK